MVEEPGQAGLACLGACTRDRSPQRGGAQRLSQVGQGWGQQISMQVRYVAGPPQPCFCIPGFSSPLGWGWQVGWDLHTRGFWVLRAHSPLFPAAQGVRGTEWHPDKVLLVGVCVWGCPGGVVLHPSNCPQHGPHPVTVSSAAEAFSCWRQVPWEIVVHLSHSWELAP